MGRRLIDVTGQRFNRLVALEKIEPRKGTTKWLCLCDCGNNVIVQGAALRNGRIKSCGCWRTKWLVTHGMCHSREYRIWYGIRERCYNPNNGSYPQYGGRGIIMHEAWRNDFAQFYRYVGPCPTKDHSLDRYPDKEGNYIPGNVRWATSSQQARNTKSTFMIDGRAALDIVEESVSDDLKKLLEKNGLKLSLQRLYRKKVKGS